MPRGGLLGAKGVPRLPGLSSKGLNISLTVSFISGIWTKDHQHCGQGRFSFYELLPPNLNEFFVEICPAGWHYVLIVQEAEMLRVQEYALWLPAGKQGGDRRGRRVGGEGGGVKYMGLKGNGLWVVNT